jgi:hypothetical protein
LTGAQAGAHLRCDQSDNQTSDYVSGPALAGDRYAYVCSGDETDTYLYAATTEQPEPGQPLLDDAASPDIRIAGAGTMLVATVNNDLMRIDADGTLTTLHHFTHTIGPINVDENRVLITVGPSTLQIVGEDGTTSAPLPLRHSGGAVLRGSRLITFENRVLTTSDLNGQTQLQRTLPAGASLGDAHGDLVLYTARMRLHLLRLGDGRDIALQLPEQISEALARFDSAGGIVVGYDTPDKLVGRIDYLQPDMVAALIRGTTNN